MCRYSKTSDDTSCGCPDWVGEGINAPVNEGSSCASSNPYWTSLSLPWLKYLKTACPTACECRKDERSDLLERSDMRSHLVLFLLTKFDDRSRINNEVKMNRVGCG